jgi:hypothetical protein
MKYYIEKTVRSLPRIGHENGIVTQFYLTALGFDTDKSECVYFNSTQAEAICNTLQEIPTEEQVEFRYYPEKNC